MTEKQIERKLVEGIKKMCGVALKLVPASMMGIPDRLVLMNGGKMWFVELKAEDGKVSMKQEKMIKKLRDMGFDAKVVEGLSGVDEFLEVARSVRN